MPIFPLGFLGELLTAEKVGGTHSHVADTVEQTVFTIDPQDTPSEVLGIWLDLNNLTKATVIRVKHKVDGTNDRIVERRTWKANMSPAVFIPTIALAEELKISLQSNIAEAGPLDVPWYYLLQVKG